MLFTGRLPCPSPSTLTDTSACECRTPGAGAVLLCPVTSVRLSQTLPLGCQLEGSFRSPAQLLCPLHGWTCLQRRAFLTDQIGSSLLLIPAQCRQCVEGRRMSCLGCVYWSPHHLPQCRYNVTVLQPSSPSAFNTFFAPPSWIPWWTLVQKSLQSQCWTQFLSTMEMLLTRFSRTENGTPWL